MDVKVSLDLKAIDRRVVEASKAAEHYEVKTQLIDLFCEGDAKCGRKEGAGRAQIREAVEQILERHWDEGKFTADLERLIPPLVEKYMMEALHEVAKHKARKLAFNKLNEMWKEGK